MVGFDYEPGHQLPAPMTNDADPVSDYPMQMAGSSPTGFTHS